jgi:superfamily II DNA or RNA helicase
MTVPIQIASNAIHAKLITTDRAVKTAVSDLLSYVVEGAQFMGAGGWDGRSSFFSMRQSAFPAGFVHLVHSELASKGHKVQLVRKPLPLPLGPDNPIVDEFGNDDPRYDYQMKALRAVEKHGRGIIQVATGGGKSKIAKLIYARYNRMTLFLTTRGVLMHQMADAAREAGQKVGFIGDGVFAPVRGLNCGMVQTFVAKLKETTADDEFRALVGENIKKELGKTREAMLAEAKAIFTAKARERARFVKLLEMFEVVIGEEAHEAGGNSYYEILKHCRRADIRIALTATPFMRANAEDNMRLMAAFGPVLIKVSEKLLIDRGILAKPFFKFERYTPHPKLRKTSPWQRARQLGIVEAPDRNARILGYAQRAAAASMPVLILVTMKAHGVELKKLLTAGGLRVEYIQGEDDQTGRKAALNRLKTGKTQVLIGTTIVDVGVDVPAIGMVILAGGGKAEVAHRQRIGRGLRAKKAPLPNVAFIVDFDDGINQHLRDHARQRRAIVEATPGFVEGILGDKEDFPWELFEKVARKVA